MAQGNEREIVADTSFLGRIILREEGWKEALSSVLDVLIHVVDFQISEIGNLLWKRRDLSVEEALVRYREAFLFLDEVHSVNEIYEEALKIAKRYGLTFYDSSVIALAKKLSLPLYTSDKMQNKIASAISVETHFFP